MNVTPASVERVQKCVFNFEIYSFLKKKVNSHHFPLYCHHSARSGYMPRHRKIEAMHDFVTTLALRSRMLGSVWYAICPCPSRTIAGAVARAKRKGDEFYQTKISIKGARKFSKKLHFRNHQGVRFWVVCFACFEPSDPLHQTVRRRGLFAARLRSFAESPRGFQYWELTSGLFPGQTSRT